MMAEVKEKYKSYSSSSSSSISDSNESVVDIKEKLSNINASTFSSESVSVNASTETLGDDGLNEALALSFKGTIWVTRDGTTWDIDHGHAGMVYATASWCRLTLEHRGSGSSNPLTWLTAYSQEYDLDDDTYWQNRKTLRIYWVSDVPNGTPNLNSMMFASDYCALNLMGIPYSPVAAPEGNTAVSCSTLMHKAYYEHNANDPEFPNIDVGNRGLWSFTILPVDLVKDEKLIPFGYFNWSGNMHTWDLTDPAGGGGGGGGGSW
ncbi:MAG: hypothetical protein PHF30_04670 [Bacilli bacterium]|nr:hypothetical protein [Bacilli bacterium]